MTASVTFRRGRVTARPGGSHGRAVTVSGTASGTAAVVHTLARRRALAHTGVTHARAECNNLGNTPGPLALRLTGRLRLALTGTGTALAGWPGGHYFLLKFPVPVAPAGRAPSLACLSTDMAHGPGAGPPARVPLAVPVTPGAVTVNTRTRTQSEVT